MSSRCKRCRIIRSVVILGVMCLIVLLANLERFSAV